jgi:hypothetical protein
MHARLLLLCYLVFRIVFCPCLCGLSPHDATSRSLFAWAGDRSLAEGLSDPSGPEPEQCPCICDGADVPVPVLLIGPDPIESNLGIPDLACDGSAEALDDHHSADSSGFRWPTVSKTSAVVRAELQNFRC